MGYSLGYNLWKRGYLGICVAVLSFTLFLFVARVDAQEAFGVSAPVPAQERERRPATSGNSATATFPDLYRQETLTAIRVGAAGIPAGAETKDEAKKSAQNNTPQQPQPAPAPVDDNPEHLAPSSLLRDADILAYYGHPNSRNMGVLGRMSKEALLKRLNEQADAYRAVDGGRKIIEAFYIIYATVQPEGRIGIIGDERLKEYIDFALENHLLVFLDHQIGRYDPVRSVESMFQFLKYPNVQLALDPEWRTDKPMQEIGFVTGDEVNRAQQAMEDYIVKNNIQGERLFVVHQFNWDMIRNRGVIRTDFPHVRLVICMDGYGNPTKKRDSYQVVALAKNIPVKAFKLFYDEKGNVGRDRPIMSPKEVMSLNPPPRLIMYQ